MGFALVIALWWAIPEIVMGFQASPLLQTSVSCRMGRQNVVPRMQLGMQLGPTHAESASDGTRRSVLVETLGRMVVGIMMLPATASADTCTRKDCQVCFLEYRICVVLCVCWTCECACNVPY